MPRGLWRNLEGWKQNYMLERLSAGFRRPMPSGSPDRMDAAVRRLPPQPFANQILRMHGIALIEHDYPKVGDPARTSRFSARLATDGAGAFVPLTINYDGTTSGALATQNEVDSFAYTGDGQFVAVASAASGEVNGRRRVQYPPGAPVIGPYEGRRRPAPAVQV